MDFHKTKLAIKFYDLENIHLLLLIIQKEPETIERTDFDGIVPKRQDSIKVHYIQLHPPISDEIKCIDVLYCLENMHLPF